MARKIPLKKFFVIVKTFFSKELILFQLGTLIVRRLFSLVIVESLVLGSIRILRHLILFRAYHYLKEGICNL